MLGRIRIYRIISFAIIFFSMIVIGTNLFPFIYGKKENLISLFYVRKDNITGELQGEIYPIAFYKNGQYIDASVDITGEDARQPRKRSSYLDNIKQFVILEEGKRLGEFTVDQIQTGNFMCSEILTGRSKKIADSSLLNIFNNINNSNSSCSIGSNQQKEFNYSLKWTLAVSNYNKKTTVSRNTIKTDVERYKKDILNIGTDLLAQYKSDGEDKGVDLEDIRIFDLDHDGYPEVTAKLKKPLQKIIKVYRDGEEHEEYSNDNVYLNLWINYKGDNPKIILSLISEQREGSWGSGYDLIGTADVNGDGIDEVIIRSSSWEVVDFEIYEYRKDKLERVFRGAGFGC